MLQKLNKSIQLHVAGLRWIVLQLSKGKYLGYFIPGVLISLVFYQLFGWTSTMYSKTYIDHSNMVSTFLDNTIRGTFDLLGFFLTQLQVFFVLTVLSPLFTWLSEKTDENLTGNLATFDLVQFISEMFRMVGIVLLSLFFEGILFLLYSILSGIFNLDWFDPIFAFCLASYFYGFAFYDYSLERYQIGVFTSLSFARQKAMLNFVTGICFSAISLVPVVGLAIASVIATMLATYVFLADNNKIKKIE